LDERATSAGRWAVRRPASPSVRKLAFPSTFVARIQTGLFTTGANLQRRIYDRGEMDISIVIPVYNEREALPALYHAMVEALDRLPQSAEIIFLDDGSNGGSADIFDGFAETDERVQVLHYSETMARRPR